MAGKKKYEQFMSSYRVQHRTFEKKWFRNAIELIRKHNILHQNSKVVDYGCGALEFLELLQSNFKINHAYGGDIIVIEPIKELGDSLGINLFEFDGEDINSTRKEFETFFDFSSCLETLEHVFDVDSFMQIIYKNTKDKGYFILSVPNIIWLKYYLHALKGGIPYKEGHHVRFFNLARIKQYIIQNGFSIIDQNHVAGSRFRNFFYKRKKNDKSLLKNISMKQIVFLTQKDKNFFPIGVAESHHNKERFLEINGEQKKYMLNKIKNELLKTNCISKRTYNYLKRLLVKK